MNPAGINRESLSWRTAEKSASVNCVEIARVDQGTIAFRNSRHPDGEMIIYTDTEFAAFVDSVKRGEFDDLLPRPGA